MLKIILISIIIAIVIILIFHIKKFITNKREDEINLDQFETYKRNKIEESIHSKNIMIIRKYNKLNSLINKQNLKKYENQIEFVNNDDLTISDVLNNNKLNVFLEEISFSKKLPIIRQLGSDLSIENKILITKGNISEVTPILCTTFNRTFIHILKGSVNICLFSSNHKNSLELENNNLPFLKSSLDKNSKNFENKKKDQIEIILREGNILFLPNNWSFYIKYNQNTIFLTYSFNSIVSKLVNLIY